ncbi:hypothetical protein BH11MYX1_BH11MYX1_45870 [soil metagenome]
MSEWDDTVLSGEVAAISGTSNAYLVIVRGTNVGTTLAVTGPTVVIGRGIGADLRIDDEGVSRLHCKLHVKPDMVFVEDLGSRNGTFCNGERIALGLRQLNEGDRLQIGSALVMRLTYADQPTSDAREDSNDPVTGARSRRHLMTWLETEVAANLTRTTPLSLVLVHVDRFTDIQADHGQPVLDAIMADIATRIRTNPCKNDILARIGPGEFVVGSVGASPADTFMFAERLRKGSMQKPTLAGMAPVTLSLGVAAITELEIETAHDLLLAAGTALHRARSQGGNRAVLCTSELFREPKGRVSL